MRAYPLSGLTFWAVFFISIWSQSCLCSAWNWWLKITSLRTEDSLQGGYRKNYLCWGNESQCIFSLSDESFFCISDSGCASYIMFHVWLQWVGIGYREKYLWLRHPLSCSMGGNCLWWHGLNTLCRTGLSPEHEEVLKFNQWRARNLPDPVNTVCPVCTSLPFFSSLSRFVIFQPWLMHPSF